MEDESLLRKTLVLSMAMLVSATLVVGTLSLAFVTLTKRALSVQDGTEVRASTTVVAPAKTLPASPSNLQRATKS